ncbi:hypothetical protein I4F81_002542 [Pyropia yezoensis]|uniref:Uncharacterized protein n=1 Tax=Pyropia yezoensis TaxID=2788 RepID=A0ACC3BPP6_PYRYE|nr:hypothetical protein I4F81_002542 [Neopyropia yezoensis]
MQTLDQVYSVVRSRPLGTGAFSSVVLAFHSQTGRAVAVKTVNLQALTPRERAAAVAEPTLLRQLRHPNIVQLADVFVDPDAGTLSVLTALAAGGSLAAAASRDGRLPGTAARFGEPAARLILANRGPAVARWTTTTRATRLVAGAVSPPLTRAEAAGAPF